jgi:hypothetical protein
MKTAQNMLIGHVRRTMPAELVTPLRSVRQDKPRTISARIGTSQPAPQKKGMRPHRANTDAARSQKSPIPKRKTVHLTLWVKPGVKEELQRRARSEGISVSATGGAFLEQAMQQAIDMHYGALLLPVIRQGIRNEMHAYSNRLAMLLVRSLFGVEQTRALVTNILARHSGIEQTEFDAIMEGSKNTAKRNIKHLSPHLQDLVNEIVKGLREEGEDAHEN